MRHVNRNVLAIILGAINLAGTIDKLRLYVLRYMIGQKNEA
jgi:hypothetical protein